MSITPFFHVYHKYVFNMANINKIRLSGTTYEIQDLNATKTVELTQAEYDALSPKDPNVFYIITDAKAGDLSNYYTKTEADGLLDTKLDVTAYTPTDLSNYYTKSETSGATEISTALASKADTATTYTKTETDNAITAATSTKQDTLVSGTNIKTINSQSILGEGNIDIQGGGINVDQSLDSGSTNPVANSAITNAIYNQTARFDGNASDGYLVSLSPYEDKNFIGIIGGKIKTLADSTPQSSSAIYIYTSIINGKKALSNSSSNTKDFSLVETSAITTSISSSSTDAQIPSAKAVNDQFGGLKLVKLTQSEYDSLTTKDNSILYVIVN